MNLRIISPSKFYNRQIIFVHTYVDRGVQLK